MLIQQRGIAMKNSKFDVKIFYSGFCTYQVLAKNKDEAIKKARKLKINNTEVLSSLENWEEADEAESEGELDLHVKIKK
jgi:hypothetical protein